MVVSARRKTLTLRIHLPPMTNMVVSAQHQISNALEAEIAKINHDTISEGELKILNDSLYVKTKDGMIKINSLQPEGKQVISSRDFINGYLDLKQKTLKFEYI